MTIVTTEGKAARFHADRAPQLESERHRDNRHNQKRQRQHDFSINRAPQLERENTTVTIVTTRRDKPARTSHEKAPPSNNENVQREENDHPTIMTAFPPTQTNAHDTSTAGRAVTTVAVLLVIYFSTNRILSFQANR